MRLSRAILVPTLFIASIACKNSGQEKDRREFSGDKFSVHIRTTEARTPEEELLGFKLPEGFEITCFASEPDIGKPINLAFDAKGRLWVTQSYEYPFPAAPGKGRDKLTILEDTDNDGKADKFTVFSDTLNIPIGILPMNDGPVVYSIPNVYKFYDNNGDDKPDGQKILVGPFKTHDTHGMINNLLRGFDGWIHSCHGYSNRDTVAGADGDSISMISGNTFRIRPDGSRVEKTTDGRINPFGLVYDERGYLYSTDCHTSPLYQLIRNADYTQWGKEEGMGFAPDMTPLSDEATALAGIAYYADKLWPESFRGNFFVGDVVRCRVYRYSAAFEGASPIGKREEDFMLSDDPWFRPVDVKMGPDGALYIADFYNSIIGHYEVPLDHPKRDKARGRIWRITYKGKSNERKDWTKASVEELVKALDNDNMFIRMTAADQLADRIGGEAVQPVAAVLGEKNVSTRKYAHALWVLYRLGALQVVMLQSAATQSDPVIRLHALHILAELKGPKVFWATIVDALEDKDPQVQRAAIELLPDYPTMESLQLALKMRKQAPASDEHMVYVTRLAMRNLLRSASVMKQAATTAWSEQDANYIADVLMGVPSQDAGSFLFKYVSQYKPAEKRAPAIFQHIARFAPVADLDAAVRIAINYQWPDSLSIPLYQAVQSGLTQRGGKETALLANWGRSLAGNVLQSYSFSKENRPSILQMQTFAADMAGKYKMNNLAPQLEAMVQSAAASDIRSGNDINHDLVILKAAALRALMKMDTRKGSSVAQLLLGNDQTDVHFRNEISRVIGEFPGTVANNILAGAIKNAPPDLQTNMAVTLAASAEGKNILFQSVKNNEIYPRVLLEPRVRERIFINITPAQKKQFEELTKNVSPIDSERQVLIDERLQNFQLAMNSGRKPPVDSGQIVFVQKCSPCHSINGAGGDIGPNLDGVSQWGAKALTEKIIDPNRNVTEDFRMYTIRLKDGKVTSGLFRREEGATVVFADISGKEFPIAKQDIAEQTPSKLTLMPDNFGQTLSQQEFNSLVHFLLNSKNEK